MEAPSVPRPKRPAGRGQLSEINYRFLGQAAVVALIAVAAYMGALGAVAEMDMSFDHRIVSRLSPGELWKRLNQAVTDSKRSELWPDDIVSVVSDGLVDGSVAMATYKYPNVFEDKFPYRILSVVPGSSFAYETLEGHPLSGGGQVWITPDNAGSLLRWTASYKQKHYSWAPLFFRIYFDRMFFSGLISRMRGKEVFRAAAEAEGRAPQAAPKAAPTAGVRAPQAASRPAPTPGGRTSKPAPRSAPRERK